MTSTPEVKIRNNSVLGNLKSSLDVLSRHDTFLPIDSTVSENVKGAIAEVGRAISQRIENGTTSPEAHYKLGRVAIVKRSGFSITRWGRSIRYFLEPTDKAGDPIHEWNDEKIKGSTVVVDVGLDNDAITDVGFVEGGENPYRNNPHIVSVREFNPNSSDLNGLILNNGEKVERLYETILAHGIQINPDRLTVDYQEEGHFAALLERFPFSKNVSPSTEDILQQQADNWLG